MSDEIELATLCRYTPRFTVHYTDTGESIHQMQASEGGMWVRYEDFAELRKENERYFETFRTQQNEIVRLLDVVAELRSIWDRILEWYEAGHQGYSDIEDIIAAAKASKEQQT